jgi:hypothetical protein
MAVPLPLTGLSNLCLPNSDVKTGFLSNILREFKENHYCTGSIRKQPSKKTLMLEKGGVLGAKKRRLMDLRGELSIVVGDYLLWC